MVTTPPHKLLEPGTNFTTDPKRKEPAEPMVCPEEYKRRRFPPSGMAKRISGSFLQKFDGDDSKGVGKGEGKGKKWMMSDFFRPQAEAEDDKRNKQDMLLNIEKAKSDPRLEQVRNARYIAFWQAEVKKTNEELRKKDVVHQLDQAEVRKMKEELRKKDSVHQLDQAEVEKVKEELRKKDAAHQIDEAELKTAIDDLLKNCAAHQLDQATTESRLQMETNRLEHAWTEVEHLQTSTTPSRLTSTSCECWRTKLPQSVDAIFICLLRTATWTMKIASRHILYTKTAARSRWLTSSAKLVGISTKSSPELSTAGWRRRAN
jgi:hypothetical protein